LERFQNGSATHWRSEEQHVVHGLFTEVMVNPENPLLVEGLQQNLVQFLGGNLVASERLFHDDARAFPAQPALASCSTTVPNTPAECEIMRRPLRRAEFLLMA